METNCFHSNLFFPPYSEWLRDARDSTPGDPPQRAVPVPAGLLLGLRDFRQFQDTLPVPAQVSAQGMAVKEDSALPGTSLQRQQ